MFSSVDSDRERLKTFLPWVEFTRSVKDSVRYIKSTERDWKSRDMFDFGLFEKSSGVYMGNFGVHTLQWFHRVCELGYWIHGRFEGKGYVSEAVRLIEKPLFDLGFHRIEIRCDSRNQRSANIPRRCGYQLDARLREDRYVDGQFYDSLVFSKLSHDRT
jgi:hypothetical protein